MWHWSSCSGGKQPLNFLVIDSKLTPCENLAKPDYEKFRFLTIRRRGKNIIREKERAQGTE